MLKITPIQTGTVTIKTKQARGTVGRSAVGRKLDMLLDNKWTVPLPIHCWLIEHPEGLFLVDTGDTAAIATAGYLPRWINREVQVRVAPDEEVGWQLRDMGIKPKDLNMVILTHYHHDHTGGLYHFPHTRIVGPREGWALANSPQGKMMGCLPQRWPIWFQPELFDFDGPAVGPFAASHALSRDGSLLALPTPGHFAGHISVLARDGSVSYLVAGDVTYNQQSLLDGVVDGVTNNPAQSLASVNKVKALAQQEPLVLLPAHDPDAPLRLAARLVVPV